MNDHFSSPPPPPDEEAHDPLLRALRQRLGEGFGQEPSPQLWASIREQLPATLPWWRRRRFLLPLLALLLLSTGALWQAGRLHRAGLRAGRVAPPASIPLSDSQAKARQSATHPAAGSLPASSLAARLPAPAGAPLPGRSAGAGVAVASRPGSPASGIEMTAEPGIETGRPATRGPVAHARLASAAKRASRLLVPKSALPSAAARARQLMAIAGPLAAAHRRPARRTARVEEELHGQATRWAGSSLRATMAKAALADSVNQMSQARRDGAVAGQRSWQRHRAQTQPTSSPELLQAGGQAPRGQVQRTPLPIGGAPPMPAGALALLAGRATELPLPRLGLPAPLAATDVPGPWPALGRRWVVQVLAGPSLSYRTVPQAKRSVAYNYSNNSLMLNDSSEVGLERPALGWGAQVQLRRVLAGRWALAAGLGYQEYATRLSLDVTTYAFNSPVTAVVGTTTAVRQRDTYRLLTLPVQLTYQLGPHGPWQLGVLGGAEPGLYLGGRTTENSGCNCQQQTFTAASGSPYRPLSLALSLGLDVRYRLGGPAGRWWLLAQPTGRYVLTPLVRSDAYGYAQRQPYGVGLLLGTAWEW